MIYDVNSFFLLAFINRSYYQLYMEVVCQFYPLFSNGRIHSYSRQLMKQFIKWSIEEEYRDYTENCGYRPAMCTFLSAR